MALLFFIGVLPLIATYRAYRGSLPWAIVAFSYVIFGLKATGPIAEYVSPFMVLPPCFLLIAMCLNDGITFLTRARTEWQTFCFSTIVVLPYTFPNNIRFINLANALIFHYLTTFSDRERSRIFTISWAHSFTLRTKCAVFIMLSGVSTKWVFNLILGVKGNPNASWL